MLSRTSELNSPADCTLFTEFLATLCDIESILLLSKKMKKGMALWKKERSRPSRPEHLDVTRKTCRRLDLMVHSVFAESAW